MDTLCHTEIARLCKAVASELRSYNGNRIGLLADAFLKRRDEAARAATADEWLMALRGHGVLLTEIQKVAPQVNVCIAQLVEFVMRNFSPGSGRDDAVVWIARLLEGERQQ